MRISDWSSDVCSSDLALSYRVGAAGHLAEGAVSKIIKDRLRAYLIKLANAGKLPHVKINEIVDATSAHSLRVGCDQDLFAAGVDLGAIMQGLRWPSPKQPLAYARHLAPATSQLASTKIGFASFMAIFFHFLYFSFFPFSFYFYFFFFFFF